MYKVAFSYQQITAAVNAIKSAKPNADKIKYVLNTTLTLVGYGGETPYFRWGYLLYVTGAQTSATNNIIVEGPVFGKYGSESNRSTFNICIDGNSQIYIGDSSFYYSNPLGSDYSYNLQNFYYGNTNSDGRFTYQLFIYAK